MGAIIDLVRPACRVATRRRSTSSCTVSTTRCVVSAGDRVRGCRCSRSSTIRHHVHAPRAGSGNGLTMTRRLPASERRAAVLDTACRVFSRCSYHAATTAEIAREAGVTEPILYRHFASKQALYLACIDEAWMLRTRVVGSGRSTPSPTRARGCRRWPTRSPSSGSSARRSRDLWLHALTAWGDEPEVREVPPPAPPRRARGSSTGVRRALRRRPASSRPTATRGRRRGSSSRVGLLAAVAGRLGGLQPGDLERIRAARQRWLTGA